MGSVKDLKVLKAPEKKEVGTGRFYFSDRYSIFDWGEMPDHIPNKGKSLCLLSAYFFEKLQNYNVNSHYRGLIENDQLKTVEQLENPSEIMEVDLVKVIEPEYNNGKYDYSPYQKNPVNCLIPLEIIYRNTLPENSSFRKRVKNNEINIKDYGLSKLPGPAEKLSTPIFDVSTKLEATDRYISWQEASRIAGLNKDELQAAKKVLTTVNNLINEEVKKAGLSNLDGKIELAFDKNRNIIVVDAIGTPDECRFSYNNFSISKEAIRKYYRNTTWYREVSKAKEAAGPDWRSYVNSNPEPLPEELKTLVSQLYMACTNKITGRKWFNDIPSFETIKEKISSWL
ncbi:MAG: phosphoribosylaminoimidazolesuccinocarboxamide synthase [Halanaerobiales bacterium]